MNLYDTASYAVFELSATAVNPLFLKIFKYIPNRLKNDLVKCQMNPLPLSGDYNREAFEACLAWAVRVERYWLKDSICMSTEDSFKRSHPIYNEALLWIQNKLKKPITYACDIADVYDFKHLDSIIFNQGKVGSPKIIERIGENSRQTAPDNLSKIEQILTSKDYACFRNDNDMKDSIDEILRIIRQ